MDRFCYVASTGPSYTSVCYKNLIHKTMNRTYRYTCSSENETIYEESDTVPTVCVNDGSPIVPGSLTLVQYPLQVEEVEVESLGAIDFNNCGILDISHSSLDDIGTNTHAQIDSHISNDTIHQVVTASNKSGGTGLFDAKVGSDLQFKSLSAGNNIQLNVDSNTIRVDADTLKWQGSWVLQSYNVNDVVEHLGSAYICIATTTIETPLDTNFWAILAAKGGSGGISGPGSTKDLEVVVFDGTDGSNVVGTGRRDYGARATNPSSPSPGAGDRYYNTTLNHEMQYDASRGKWLSVATLMDGAGVNGRTRDGDYFRRFHGMTMSATRGPYVQKGTIVRIGFTNLYSAKLTYDVLVNGSVVASLNSGGSATADDDQINADFEEGIMSSRNRYGGADAYSLQSTIYYKLRA